MSRDEMNEKNSQIHTARFLTENEILSELKIHLVLRKIQNYKEWLLHILRVERHKLPNLLMNYHPQAESDLSKDYKVLLS